jgi:hypothetical protein
VTTSKGVAGTRILFNSASDHGFMGRYPETSVAKLSKKSLLMVDEESDANAFKSTQTPLKRCIL